jgi:pimeloyl-ACP methyl ester carboxylesterase
MPDYWGGMRFSVEKLWPQVLGWRMADGGLSFDVPLVFVEGELDMQVPTALVTEITPKMKAPAVELAVIEGAAHCALLTHPDQFRRELESRVRPLVIPKTKRKRSSPSAQRA